MKRSIQIATIILFVLILWAPIAQRKFDFAPRYKLHNIYIEQKIHKFTWESFLEGKWQTQYATWFKRNNGLWGWLVRNSNSLNLNVFGLPTTSYDQEMILGADGAILERAYINDINGLNLRPRNELIDLANKIAKINKAVTKLGNVFLVVISPTKPVIEPQWVPQTLKSKTARDRNWEILKPMLLERDVPVLDLTPIILEKRQELGVPFFPSAGAHMNTLGKCFAAKEVLAALEKRLPGKIASLDCQWNGEMIPPEGEDNDIAKLLNVWDYQPFIKPVPKAEVTYTKAPNKQDDLSLLLSGTSFNFGLLSLIEKGEPSWSERDFFFYFKTRYHHNVKKSYKKKKTLYDNSFDIDFLKSRDIIILEATEARTHHLGFGLINNALSKFPKKQP